MNYCINPKCRNPQNIGQPLFCQACGSELLLQGIYRVIRPLGGGGFGKTFEVADCGTLKVLKVLHNTHPKAIELFQQEVQVLSQLNHPGIPQVESDSYFTFFPRGSQEALHCLIMEKIEGMNLEEYMIRRSHQPIAKQTAIRWLKQLTEILAEVHQQQYFHRDIKPSNIMLKPDGQLVLIDFGSAREVTQTYMQKLAGQKLTGIISPGYTPSEQMNGKAVPQSDFFALGRTFVFLLTGKHPNDYEEDPRTGDLIWRDSAVDIWQPLADLIDDLMAPFPGNRPKNSQVILQSLEVINQKNSSSQSSSQSSGNSLAETVISQPDNYEYAGFMKRVFAHIIDSVILVILGTLIGVIYTPVLMYHLPLYTLNSGAVFWWFGVSLIGTFLIGEFLFIMMAVSDFLLVGRLLEFIPVLAGGLMIVVSQWLYFCLLESSPKQATFGKMMLRIIVTDINGKRISFGYASKRYWGKKLSAILIFIGFIMVWITKKKQGLHDMMAATLVIKKK